MTKRPILAALFALSALPAHALTQEDVLSARLLSGWQTESGTRMAAVELTLAPGWKTYWRSPGEAGIPPSFDFTGSTNLKSVIFHWPRPSVFDLNGMQTIGYHDGVVLPMEIRAKDPSAPVTLRLGMDLGVCSDICLPASLSFDAELGGKGATDPAIRAALADMPRPATSAGLTGIGCAVEPIRDGLRVTAAVDMPELGPDETVVFETKTQGVWVSEATASREGSTLTAVSDMVPPEGAPFALDRSGVTVTVIAENSAVEISGCPAP